MAPILLSVVCMDASSPGGGTTVGSVWHFLRRRASAFTAPLSRLETVIGVTTGLLSVGAALFGVGEYLKAPPPDKGQIVAIIEDVKTQKALSGATVEILTGKQTVLTSLTTNWFGRASHHLGEGQYQLRVRHPKFAAEVREVQVVSGQTTEIRVGLRAGSGSLRQVERVIHEGIGAVRRLLD